MSDATMDRCPHPGCILRSHTDGDHATVISSKRCPTVGCPQPYGHTGLCPAAEPSPLFDTERPPVDNVIAVDFTGTGADPLDADRIYYILAIVAVPMSSPPSFGVEVAHAFTEAVVQRYRTSTLLSEIDGKKVPTKPIAQTAVHLLAEMLRRVGAQGRIKPPLVHEAVHSQTETAFLHGALIVGGTTK